ncbi:MAG TPA: protein rep [Polyangiaceae bacterium]|nr:protein rep [Polyangiaceae bacterium]
MQLQRRSDGSKRVSGVLSCGSVWACPVCAQRICSHRADELKSVLEDHTKRGSGCATMLTLTIRHQNGDDLVEQRKGLADAHRRLWQGKGGKKLRALLNVKHSVRALEVTHGPNGWHSHTHSLLLGNQPPEPEALDYLKQRWMQVVEKALGPEHAPNWDRGATLVSAKGSTYLAKLGLEISHGQTKEGREGHRTPWQIAQDAAAGDEESKTLWKYYCRAMKGARQLNWSRGMRRFFGLGLRDSDAAVVEADDASKGTLIAEWDGADWDACARADPLWVSRVALVEDYELEGLPRARRFAPVEDFSAPDVEAGSAPAQEDL